MDVITEKENREKKIKKGAEISIKINDYISSLS